MNPQTTNIDNFLQVDYDCVDSFQNYLSSTSRISDDTISIFHLNIRSLDANFSAFEHFFSLLNTKVDFIVLTECWLQNAEMYNNISTS